MEITQDHIDFAANQESDILSRSMLQAQVQIMNDRIVTLRAYAKALEELCEENDIDYSLPEREEVERPKTKKPTDRKPRSAAKKTASAGKTGRKK